MLSIPQIEKLRNIDPYLYEVAVKLRDAVNAIAKQTGADPRGVFSATPNITAVNVTSANGDLNIQIVDSAFVNNPALQGRAIIYFIEIASDAGFLHVIQHLTWHGARNGAARVGNQTVYVRAYSQLQGSPASIPVVSQQNPVAGGGALAPPANQTYQGCGTSPVSGKGFGVPIRSGGVR